MTALAGAAFAVVGAGAQEPPHGAADCLECHADQVHQLALSPHVALDREGRAAKADAEYSCAACHGDATAHVESEGVDEVLMFDESDFESSARCLACHADSHPRFRLSSHAKAGMQCTSCHRVHEARAVTGDAPHTLEGRPSQICAGCHSDALAQFMFTEHHRLEEGALECTSCHNPHEPATRMLLGGFKQEACLECHEDKGGPFVFEHASSRVEGCTACHSPHGSPNRHLLAFQSVAELCFSCHAVVPGFHSRFTLDSQCTECHSQIHGSNLSPVFFK